MLVDGGGRDGMPGGADGAAAHLLSVRACERARLARDARFDGRFFVAVTSTKIYCRPVCPAPAPRPAHVRYFPTAAAAAAAGFRPCLRCRPEASPGTPAWAGTSAIVGRALRLIGAGALGEGGVDALAARLGIGPRHLHRLFVQHLGASPIGVAQTARVEVAKRLIDETTMPMTEIALAAGFGSVRRFNDAFRRAYGRAPSTLRRSGRGASTDRPYRLRLAYRPPFDWEALLAFLGPRAIRGVEAIDGGCYRRVITARGCSGLLEVRHLPRDRALEATIAFPDPLALPQIVARVRAMFDLGADPRAIARVLRRDARLAPFVARRPGLRVPGAWDPFEVAVRAIVGQQISVRGAVTVLGRLAERFGTPVDRGPAAGWTAFPTAAVLADGDGTTAGLMPARARTLRELSSAVASGRVALDIGTDPAELTARLTALPGIGPWTAAYIALRGLGDPDAFPASDLGLRTAAGAGQRLGTRELERRADAWRPWRGYAAMYLWQGA